MKINRALFRRILILLGCVIAMIGVLQLLINEKVNTINPEKKEVSSINLSSMSKEHDVEMKEQAAEKKNILLSEGFDRSLFINEYMPIHSKMIVNDGGNQVYRLRDEASPILGNGSWRNYTITGKVKINQGIMDGNRFNSSFEIIPRLKEHSKFSIGGQGGVPFIYRIEKNDMSYMRIMSSPGPNVNLMEKKWYPFEVKIIDNQMIFKLADRTMYYSLPLEGILNGGFGFRAENCEIYLDDLVVMEEAGGFYDSRHVAQLVFDHNDVIVNKYEMRNISELTALKLIYLNETGRYISERTDIEWSIVGGEDIAEVFHGGMVRIKHHAKQDDQFVIRATLLGNTADLLVTVEVPEKNEQDYILDRTQIRQYSLLTSMQHYYHKGLRLSLDNKPPNELPYLFAQMLLHPREKNYDDELNWLVNKAATLTVLGGSDFIVTQMVLTRLMLEDHLLYSQSVWDNMTSFLRGYHYEEPPTGLSENHMIQNLVGAYLTAEADPQEIMWNERTGLENQAIFKNHIINWIKHRLNRGMGEFNSISYYGIDLEALSMLFTFVQDNELKQAANVMLQFMYGNMAVISLEGMMSGAHGRTYKPIAPKVVNGGTPGAVNLLFDNLIWKHSEKNLTSLQSAPLSVSMYRPSPILFQIMRDREKNFHNRQRNHIYTIPDDPAITESLKTYTHVTPDYAMGAVVQMDIPQDLTQVGDKLYKDTSTYPSRDTWVLASHQEWSWSLSFAKSLDVIFSHHPGNVSATNTSAKHNYWSGDYTCLCYKHFQEDNVLIGMYRIPAVSQNVAQAQFIHFWLPKNRFEQVDEQDGWIFVKQSGVYAAIKPLKDGTVTTSSQYVWTTEGANANIELKVNSPEAAFIVETANSNEFGGTFAQFQTAILNNDTAIVYDLDAPGTLKYTGLNGKELKLEYNKDQRFIGNQEVDFTQYALFDSPYMNADWDDGSFTLSYDGVDETWSID